MQSPSQSTVDGMELTFQLPKRHIFIFLLDLNLIFLILFFERKFGDFTVRISGSPSNWTIPEMEKRGERVRQDRREGGFPSRNGGGFRCEPRQAITRSKGEEENMRLLHRLLEVLFGVVAAVAFWRFGGSRGGWKRREGGSV